MSLPDALLESGLFVLKESPLAGRGIYAVKPIPKDTLLLETSDIAASVIYREYRKEVCSQCFRYDGGREWRIRDHEKGVVFCDRECQSQWIQETHPVTIKTLITLQSLTVRGWKDDLADDDLDESRPTAEMISATWAAAEDLANRVRSARDTASPRANRNSHALKRALNLRPLRYILFYALSSVLCAFTDSAVWSHVHDLAASSTPYASSSVLTHHIKAYHLLLACCPVELLPYITAENLLTSAQKSAHNSFNIWSQESLTPDLTDHIDPGSAPHAPSGEVGDTSECLGLALWPHASYWNHSCAPTIRKRRKGRTWQFWTARDVHDGEELCITYLGNDVRSMTREERRVRLFEVWGFDCACIRCREGA